MARYNKREDFEVGVKLLTPFFESRGFSCEIEPTFEDKEGVYYSARFTKGRRSVEIGHLYSLYPIVYRHGDSVLEHSAYMKALGVARQANYPSYADDSTTGYHALLKDLETFLEPFFTGSADDFAVLASAYPST
jgi:hypothetical protein